MGAMAGIAGLGMGLAGNVMGTIGNVQATDINAKLLDVQSRDILDRGAFEERQFRREASFVEGRNRAVTAASGVDISRGSPLFAALDFVKQRELEAQSIRRNTKYESDMAKFQSRMERRKIPFQIAEGILGGVGSVLKGGSILSGLGGR